MRNVVLASLLSSIALALPLLVASPAAADGLSSCGNINVSAQAQCEVVAPGVTCEGKCEPVNFKASCYGKLSAECSGSCNPPTIDCEGSCSANCEGTCSTNPDFKCSGSCTGSCEGDCDSQCSSSGDSTQCKADCKAKCSAQCSASCNGAPVECKGQCEASCKGSCKVKTSMECQLKCQADGEVKCEATMSGGCKGQCQTKDGALFCDGQYVDSGGNLKSCVDALSKIVTVKGYANASGECSGNSCEAEAEAGCSASTVPSGNAAGWPIAFGVIGALGGVSLLNRRRRNRK